MKYLSDYLAVSGASKIYKCASVDTTARTWTGYLYNRTTGLASAAANLSYDCPIAPTVGKYYTSDGWIESDVYAADGLVFYAPLHTVQTMDETNHFPLNVYGNPEYSIIDSVPCAIFNGASAIYMDSASRNITTGNFCLSVYLKVSDWANLSDTCIMANTSAGGIALQLRSPDENGSYIAFLVRSNSSYISAKMYSSQIAAGWHHFFGVFDGSYVKLYCDGVLFASSEYSGIFSNSDDASAFLTLGSDAGHSTWFLSGNMAECKIWNRVLSDAEISAESARCLAMVEA